MGSGRGSLVAGVGCVVCGTTAGGSALGCALGVGVGAWVGGLSFIFESLLDDESVGFRRF